MSIGIQILQNIEAINGRLPQPVPAPKLASSNFCPRQFGGVFEVFRMTVTEEMNSVDVEG